MDVIERLKKQRGEQEWDCQDDPDTDDEFSGFSIVEEDDDGRDNHIREIQT